MPWISPWPLGIVVCSSPGLSPWTHIVSAVELTVAVDTDMERKMAVGMEVAVEVAVVVTVEVAVALDVVLEVVALVELNAP